MINDYAVAIIRLGTGILVFFFVLGYDTILLWYFGISNNTLSFLLVLCVVWRQLLKYECTTTFRDFPELSLHLQDPGSCTEKLNSNRLFFFANWSSCMAWRHVSLLWRHLWHQILSWSETGSYLVFRLNSARHQLQRNWSECSMTSWMNQRLVNLRVYCPKGEDKSEWTHSFALFELISFLFILI